LNILELSVELVIKPMKIVFQDPTACILNDGVHDDYDGVATSFPKSLLTALENGDSEVVNTVLGIIMESDSNTRFNTKHGMWTAGINTPFKLIQQSKNYTNSDAVQAIKSPTLVLEVEKDDSFPGQPKNVYDALSSMDDNNVNFSDRIAGLLTI
jgi:hypothetical protein